MFSTAHNSADANLGQVLRQPRHVEIGALDRLAARSGVGDLYTSLDIVFPVQKLSVKWSIGVNWIDWLSLQNDTNVQNQFLDLTLALNFTYKVRFG